MLEAKEREAKERETAEREAKARKEREAKEREAKEREARERREIKEREAKEREARKREAMEREAKEREIKANKEREAKERDARNRENAERKYRKREAAEKEAKEREAAEGKARKREATRRQKYAEKENMTNQVILLRPSSYQVLSNFSLKQTATTEDWEQISSDTASSRTSTISSYFPPASARSATEFNDMKRDLHRLRGEIANLRSRVDGAAYSPGNHRSKRRRTIPYNEGSSYLADDNESGCWETRRDESAHYLHYSPRSRKNHYHSDRSREYRENVSEHFNEYPPRATRAYKNDRHGGCEYPRRYSNSRECSIEMVEEHIRENLRERMQHMRETLQDRREENLLWMLKRI